MEKVEALKALDKLEDEAIADCWKYHGDFIKSESDGACKDVEELWDYLSDLEFSDWEDIGYFTGKIRGLREARRLLEQK